MHLCLECISVLKHAYFLKNVLMKFEVNTYEIAIL